MDALLRAFNREWGRGRLILRGVAPEVVNPLNLESTDLSTPQSSGAIVLFLIAFYGLFGAVMGGMAAALDTTAGERERASLEPLLTTPVAPFKRISAEKLYPPELVAKSVTNNVPPPLLATVKVNEDPIGPLPPLPHPVQSIVYP